MTKRLTPHQIKKAKKLIKKLSISNKSLIETQVKPIYDDLYFKALEYLDKN